MFARADIASAVTLYTYSRVLDEKLLIYDEPADQYRCTKRARDTVEKFPGDRERSISTIRYFVSSAGSCAKRRRPCKKRRRRMEAPAAVPAPEEEEGGTAGWKDIRWRFQETRIVFRPGKLVIDTAEERELPRNFARAFIEVLASPPLERARREHEEDKNIFARPMLTTSPPRCRNVCHDQRRVATTETQQTRREKRGGVYVYVRTGDDSWRTRAIYTERSLNCPYAPVFYEESWPAAKHRFASLLDGRQYIFIIRLIAPLSVF